MDIIRYNSARFMADVSIDADAVGYLEAGVILSPSGGNAVHPKCFSPATRVFVKTDYLYTALDYLSSITVPFHLLTGSSDVDGCVSKEFAQKLKKTTLVQSWVGTNLQEFFPWMLSIPIGLEEQGRQSGRPEFLWFPRPRSEAKDVDIYLPPMGNTHPSRESDRVELSQLNCPRVHIETVRLPRLQYLDRLSRSNYVICLRGNGLDTIRIYETILCGAIPIVTEGPLWRLHRRLGCVIINDWSEIKRLPRHMMPISIEDISFSKLYRNVLSHQVRFFRDTE